MCRDEWLLLAKGYRQSGESFWTLSSGRLKVNKHPRDGLRREISEELSGEAEIESAVGMYSYRPNSVPNLLTLYAIYEVVISDHP